MTFFPPDSYLEPPEILELESFFDEEWEIEKTKNVISYNWEGEKVEVNFLKLWDEKTQSFVEIKDPEDSYLVSDELFKEYEKALEDIENYHKTDEQNKIEEWEENKKT